MVQHKIPEKFLEAKVRQYGEPGRAWCLRIPQLLDELAAVWDIAYDAVMPLSMNYVCRAHRRSDGQLVIVKIGFPAAEFANELAMYAHYHGRSSVPCLEIDHERAAVLFPALVPGTRLDDGGLSYDAQSAIITRLIGQHIFPNDRGVAVQSIDTVIADVFPHAQAVCANRPDLISLHHIKSAYDILTATERTGWYPLHGDIHPGNVLRHGDAYVLIDPQGLVGPKVCEVVPFLFYLYSHVEPAPAEAHARRHIVRSAEVLQLPVSTVVQWSYAMAVVSAWWTFQSTQTIPPVALAAVTDLADMARSGL